CVLTVTATSACASLAARTAPAARTTRSATLDRYATLSSCRTRDVFRPDKRAALPPPSTIAPILMGALAASTLTPARPFHDAVGRSGESRRGAPFRRGGTGCPARRARSSAPDPRRGRPRAFRHRP